MIVNNGSRPIYDYEFAKMQVKVLQLCRDELCGMQAPTSPSRTNTNTSTTESDSSSVLRGKLMVTETEFCRQSSCIHY